MTLHPQNSPRGLFVKQRVGIQSSGGVLAQLTTNSTGLVVDNDLKITGTFGINGTSRVLSANSTGILLGTRYLSTNGTSNVVT